MRISSPHKRFLRLGLLALIAALSYWVCAFDVRMAERSSAAQATRPPMYVLQVGIGKYKYTPTWAELRGAVNDVLEMRKVLTGERWGIPAENIHTLTDEQGTKEQIFREFQTHLIANAKKRFEQTKDRKEGAVILFQFSGHGSQVPDADGDEKGDKLDETLVTVESQDEPGKNFDITDDEIFALTSELRRWTDNIVYIFDSCHSGSGTRESQDVRRLPERKTVPVPVLGVGVNATRSGEAKPVDSGSGVLPPGDDYIVITAARANELASQKNCFEECGATTRPVVFGNLTFYLIDELKNARADTSYRELMENVARRVTSEKPTQTPQIEGDESRFVFGSLGRTEDNFIRIAEVPAKRSIKIHAGAMQGVTVGTLVSVYDKSVTRFDRAEKIASGLVRGVTPTDSMVDIVDPKRDVTVDDKAVVVAPDLGSLRLKVNLDADISQLTASEKETIAATKRYLTPVAPATEDPRGVDLTPTPGRWDVAVLKDKFATVSAKMGGHDVSCEGGANGPAGRNVFYLAGRDYVPLFGFCLETPAADQTTAAARRLEEVIVHLARLKSVNAIANKRSTLQGKVTVQPIRFTGDYGCANGRFTATTSAKAVADPVSGHYRFSPGNAFWFEVTNNSPMDLYVVLLNMPPDGSVKLWSPRDRAEEKDGIVIPKNGGKRIIVSDDCRADAQGNILDAGALLVSKTPGIDHFKFILSPAIARRRDFAYLEMTGVVKRDSSSSPLVGMGEWTTVETNFEIRDTWN